ncbi:NUDIX domain-containing protein, partial [Candidatus Woesearchaeota archaeon]|nr:NUDIX domain-containing protein [Candidatus Woesearchaeota archaeon]
DKNGGLYFLILHRNTSWKGWEFPKGGLEPGESIEDALRREVLEETGLRRVQITHRLPVKREFTNNGTLHSFTVFLAKANMNTPISLTQPRREHDTYLWAKADTVLEKLHWDDEKGIFRKALALLQPDHPLLQNQ